MKSVPLPANDDHHEVALDMLHGLLTIADPGRRLSAAASCLGFVVGVLEDAGGSDRTEEMILRVLRALNGAGSQH